MKNESERRHLAWHAQQGTDRDQHHRRAKGCARSGTAVGPQPMALVLHGTVCYFFGCGCTVKSEHFPGYNVCPSLPLPRAKPAHASIHSRACGHHRSCRWNQRGCHGKALHGCIGGARCDSPAVGSSTGRHPAGGIRSSRWPGSAEASAFSRQQRPRLDSCRAN